MFKLLFKSKNTYTHHAMFSRILKTSLAVCLVFVYIYPHSNATNTKKSSKKRNLYKSISPELDPYDPSRAAWPTKKPSFIQTNGKESTYSGSVKETDFSNAPPMSPLSDPNSNNLTKLKGQTGQSANFNSNTPLLKGNATDLLLQGSVQENVPVTPEDVTKYLKRMKRIIDTFTSVTYNSIMSGGGINADAASSNSARDQALQMAAQIRATVPPAQLKNAHNQLANTMGTLSSLLSSGSVGIENLGQVMSVMTSFMSSIESYHTSARNCIAYYGLDPSLDPVGSDNDPRAAQLMQNLPGFMSQKMQSLSSPPQNNNSGMGGLGGLGSLLGGGGDSGGGGGLGGLGSMLGGLGGLGSMLGGGGSGGSTPGGTGGGSSSFGGGGSFGSLGGSSSSFGGGGSFGSLGGSSSSFGGGGSFGSLGGSSSSFGGSSGGSGGALDSLGGLLGGSGAGAGTGDLGSLIKALPGLTGNGGNNNSGSNSNNGLPAGLDLGGD